MVNQQPLQFVRGGQLVTLPHVPPDRTLLQVLREDLGCMAAKEGCGQGDCGACTVVIASPRQDSKDRLDYQAVNACIRLAHSVQGMALWTAADLARDPHRIVPMQVEPAASAVPAGHAELHPVQAALVDHHGSQCGFCTPGFVMSLFALYHNEILHGLVPDRAHAQHVLSGNLCRCTGYCPILEAAQALPHYPTWQLDEAAIIKKIEQIPLIASDIASSFSYIVPDSLRMLLQIRSEHPNAPLVAGATDLGLWITKQHRQFATLIDITRIPELQAIHHRPASTSPEDDGWLDIGACATLTHSFTALLQWYPQLESFFQRFAGLPIRNAGTLGGNVANGSPIGDSMPLLIALGCEITLASLRGERRMPLEDFYLGYRQTALAKDEVLTQLHIPLGEAAQRGQVCAYKISKRQDDDISAVCLAIALHVQDGVVQHIRLGVGGVAAIPARARKTEAALQDQHWNEHSVQGAIQVLDNEFSPLSDMRASSTYRRTVLGRLLWRYWLEHSQGTDATPIAHQTLTHLGALDSETRA